MARLLRRGGAALGPLRLAVTIMVVASGLAATVPATGQETPSPGDVIGPILDEHGDTIVGAGEEATQQDLSSEDIEFLVRIDIRSAEFGVVPILFGGGPIRADAVVDAVVEFRAVSTHRLDAAVQEGTGDANASVHETFGIPPGRLALTAEEIRLVGGGALLEMFQEHQAEATRTFIERTAPGLSVLDARFSWSNTRPATWLEAPAVDPRRADPAGIVPAPTLREPPLRLDARLDMRYLEHTSVLELLEHRAARKGDAPSVKEQIKQNESVSLHQRTAFESIGFSQALDIQVPPGWRVGIEVDVPDGYTIERATDELTLGAERENAAYFLDGGALTQEAHQAGLVTISSRFVVTLTILAAVLVAGYLLRIPTEMSVLAAAYALDRRRGGPLRPSWRERVADRWDRMARRVRAGPTSDRTR